MARDAVNPERWKQLVQYGTMRENAFKWAKNGLFIERVPNSEFKYLVELVDNCENIVRYECDKRMEVYDLYRLLKKQKLLKSNKSFTVCFVRRGIL